jgi:hypothetical protein
MRNLERAVRLFRALVETDDSVQVTSATMWSWPDVEAALQSNPGAGDLLTEMRSLSPAVRERTMHYCGEFEPLEPRGDIFVFPSRQDAQEFITAMESQGAVVDHLADQIVSAHHETPDYVFEVAAKFNGEEWGGPRLIDAFENVDTDLPYAMLADGVHPSEMESALIESLWKDREIALSEAFITSQARTASDRFKGRLSSWAVARPVFGVEPRLFEALRMSGALPAKVCLMVEAEPATAPDAAVGSVAGPPADRGGVAQDQPDGQSGPPAQSAQDNPKEPPKPTEHVPTREEGGANGVMGQVKLPDGTVVPPDIMRQAIGKVLKNIATQIEQGTVGGKPEQKPEQDSGKPQGQPEQDQEEKPAEEPQQQQQQQQQPQQQATPPQNQQAPGGEQPQNPGRNESYLREDLNRALGMILSPRTRDVIAGINLVREVGFSGQTQQVVERVLDELDTLQASPNARVRKAAREALGADLYRTESVKVAVLPQGLDYGAGECEPGEPVTIVEDRGNNLVLRLQTGQTVLAPASAVALTEANLLRPTIVGTGPLYNQRRPLTLNDGVDEASVMAMVESQPTVNEASVNAAEVERAIQELERSAPGGLGGSYDVLMHLLQRNVERRKPVGKILNAIYVLLRDYGGGPKRFSPTLVRLVSKMSLHKPADPWPAESRRVESVHVAESLTEQLDVGQDDEKDTTARGFAKTAAKLKMCRQHTFDLVTADLVQLESLAKAVGAKRTIKFLAQTRDKATEFLDTLKETAELLEKANEAFKGESGGKGGDTIDQEQQVASAAPAAAPVAPAAPAPAAPAVGEAVRRIARTDVPRRILEGEVYSSIVEAIQYHVSDLGLTSNQVSEVYDRFNRVVAHNSGRPDYQVEFSRGDHRLLESVARFGSRLTGLVARSQGSRQTFATREELVEAVSTLRKHGKVEHGMLADDLEAIVG